MLKCSKNAEGTAELEEALATMLDIIKSVNDSMHQIAITGFEACLFYFHSKPFLTQCAHVSLVFPVCPQMVSCLWYCLCAVTWPCLSKYSLQEDTHYGYDFSSFQGNLNDLGKLLMQSSFNVWTDHKKGHNKVKDLARFKPMQRHLFLYNKMILFCKKREENSDGHEKSPCYSFKHSLKVQTKRLLLFRILMVDIYQPELVCGRPCM